MFNKIWHTGWSNSTALILILNNWRKINLFGWFFPACSQQIGILFASWIFEICQLFRALGRLKKSPFFLLKSVVLAMNLSLGIASDFTNWEEVSGVVWRLFGRNRPIITWVMTFLKEQMDEISILGPIWEVIALVHQIFGIWISPGLIRHIILVN